MPAFIFPFVGGFGGGTSPIPAPSLTATPLDHVEAGIRRLPQQFRGKPNIENFLRVLLEPFNELELVYTSLLLERSVNSAVGTQLDLLGKLVGQLREGRNDDDYRRFIRARIAANRSEGTIENLLKVIHLVLNDDDVVIVTETQRGTVVARLTGIVTDTNTADIVLAFARDTTIAQARVWIESYPDEDSELFTFGNTVYLSGPVSIGATLLLVDLGVTLTAEYDNLPASGQLVIDAGTSAEETVTYSYKQSGKISCSALTKTHTNHAPITLAGSSAKGKGFGTSLDSGQPQVIAYQNLAISGGRLADARGA